MLTGSRALDLGSFVVERICERPRRFQQRDSVLRAALEAYLDAGGDPGDRGSWLWTSHRATWLGPEAVVKVARGRYGEESLRRDADARRRIHAHPGTAPWRHTVPVTLWAGHPGARLVVVEQRLPGDGAAREPLAPAESAQVATYVAQLHRSTAVPTRVDDNRLLCWLLGPALELDLLLRRAGRADLGTAVERWAHRLASDLAGRAVPVGLVHGDLWPGNLLLRRHEVTGLVDWDQAAFTDVAPHDLLHLQIFPAATARRVDLGLLVREALMGDETKGGPWTVFDLREVRDGCDEVGLAPRDALTWYWLRHVSRMAPEPGHATNPRWVNRNVMTVASTLKDRKEEG